MKRSNWLSIAALALSVTACIITWLRVEIYTTNDTFVGIMAGLMGACATLVVGIQIYNSIDTRNTINDLNKSFEEKIKTLDQSIDSQLRNSRVLQNELNYELSNTKKELESTKEERRKNEFILDSGIARCHGISLHQIQPFTAILSFRLALDLALKANEPDIISSCLGDLNTQTNKLIEQDPANDVNAISLVAKIDFNEFSKYPLYPLIQKQCEDIQRRIQIKISEIGGNQNDKNEV